MSKSSFFLKVKAGTKTDASQSMISIPRGGAIVPVLSKDVAVKSFLGALGLNAATGIFTPEFHLGSYKMEVDDFSSFMAQEFCGVSLNICTLLALQLYSNMAFEKAVGWSCLPYMAMIVFKLLTDKAATVNMPKKNSYFVLVINAVVAIACLTEHTLANLLTKLYAVNSLINGIPLLFAPLTGGKMWDLEPDSNQNTLLLQWMGYGLISHFVSLLPAFGLVDDTYKVTGYITAVMSASLIGLFGFGKLKDLQLVPVLVWIALLVSITLSLL